MKKPREYELERIDTTWQEEIRLKNKPRAELVKMIFNLQTDFFKSYTELLNDYIQIYSFHENLVLNHYDHEKEQMRQELEEFKKKADDYDIKALQAKIVRLA